tara:strand:- start:681 stop:2393 length:1713 start_codon:yes stop_codon:yes gene_type:complete
MTKNTKFLAIISLLFLIACSPADNEAPKTAIKEINYPDSNPKYSAMYYKIIVELMLHKNENNGALDVFTQNIDYFDSENEFLNMINKARELRRYDLIVTILNRWFEIDTNNSLAHKIAFSIFIELGEYELANKHFNFLYNLYRNTNNKSYVDVEDILSRNIIINNIVKYFEATLADYNDDVIILSYINILQKNDLDTLAKSYIENLEINGNRILTRMYSKSLSKLNEVGGAISQLEKFIENTSIMDREVSLELIALYLKQRDDSKASLMIEKLISVDPDDDNFIFRIALLCFDNKNYNLSEKYFNILLSKSYSSDNINFFLGQIDYQSERYTEALQHYYKIEYETFLNTKISSISQAILKKDGMEEALKYLDGEVKIKTKSDLLNLLVLKLSLYEEDYEITKVINITSEILESFPNNQQALYSRALAYEKKGDITSMSVDFEKMINSNPYNSIALNAYGYSLTLQNSNLNLAEKLIRRAINIDPGNAAIIDSLAWVLYQGGNYKDAQKYSALAYSKDQDPEIIQHYYIILLKNGFKDEAGNVIKKSIIDNPDNEKLLKLFENHKDELSKL